MASHGESELQGVCACSSASVCVCRCWSEGRRAGGKDQRLQLGRFYSSYDASFRISHSPHTTASLQPVL